MRSAENCSRLAWFPHGSFPFTDGIVLCTIPPLAECWCRRFLPRPVEHVVLTTPTTDAVVSRLVRRPGADVVHALLPADVTLALNAGRRRGATFKPLRCSECRLRASIPKPGMPGPYFADAPRLVRLASAATPPGAQAGAEAVQLGTGSMLLPMPRRSTSIVLSYVPAHNGTVRRSSKAKPRIE